ncbi:hypothetical protein JCM8547_006898 [Rhodosporidiobolus lusitaniae]
MGAGREWVGVAAARGKSRCVYYNRTNDRRVLSEGRGVGRGSPSDEVETAATTAAGDEGGQQLTSFASVCTLGAPGKPPAAGRGPSADAEGAAPSTSGGGGGGGENAQSTDVDSLMDAVGASGVDLGAEEESLRATNERMHAQAMAAQQAAQAAGQAPNPQAYAGVDRSRKQDFIDPSVLAECVKKVAAAFQLKTLEPDTIPLIALATRHRLMSLVNASIAARDHRQSSSHFRVPPFVTPSSSSSRKKRRRDETGLVDDEDPDGDDDEDEEMLDASGSGESKRQKVPAWDTLVYDDPERYLSVLERVEREEERRKRRERMVRDQREQEQRELAEAMAASEAARLALEAEGKGPDGQPLAKAGKGEDDEEDGGGAGGRKGGKKKDAKGKGKAKDTAPSTPGGKVELDKNGKPKKERKKKPPKGGVDSGTSTPAAGTPVGGGGTGTKNLAEDIKKRLTDQTALRSLGGQKFSWLNAGIGSPSPAGGLGSVGGAGGLPKPKFAPGASSLGSSSGLPPPSFAPTGGANGTTSTSLLNPANNSSASASFASTAAKANTAAASSALTTSRLNVPPLHDAQRTQLAKNEWEAGHHVVELGDLLFALERERGMGVGRGSGRGAAVRGRAGITRGAYGGGGAGGGRGR